MILVTGASGQLGGRVARRLLEAGTGVRAVSRNPSRLDPLAALGAEVVTGDLLDPRWMPEALRGVSGIVVASHGIYPPSRTNHPEAVDGRGTRWLIDEAARSGSPHVVLVSMAGAERGETAIARIKFDTERHLAASDLPFTVLRPTVFIENHVLVLLGEPARKGAPVIFAGRGTAPLNWVSADDVAEAAVRAVRDPGMQGRALAVGGPDVMSRVEALAVVDRVLGTRSRRRHIPAALLRGVRALTPRLHPGVHQMMDVVLAEEALAEADAAPPHAYDHVGLHTVREVVEAWARAG
jgi:uncharacterized protein YbjT (DUF2867 family)